MDEVEDLLKKIIDCEIEIINTEKRCKTFIAELNEIKIELKKYLIPSVISIPEDSDKYSLYFDGCSKGNPGLAGAGGVIYKNDIEILTFANFLGDKKTNNEAEYLSLSIGIDEAIKLGIKSIDIYGDSQLVINQILGKYAINSFRLKEYFNDIKKKIIFFDKITFTHVLRDKNKRADELSNIALNKKLIL